MSNENTVSVKAVRSFEGEEGYKSPGDQFSITRQRFADLKANGLVEEAGEKMATEPENKQAPKHANKSAPKHDPK